MSMRVNPDHNKNYFLGIEVNLVNIPMNYKDIKRKRGAGNNNLSEGFVNPLKEIIKSQVDRGLRRDDECFFKSVRKDETFYAYDFFRRK